MDIWRKLVSLSCLLVLLNSQARASPHDPWDTVSSSVSKNQNVVVNTVLWPEMQAALRGASYPKAVTTNCNERDLPVGVRVLVFDLYFPGDYQVRGAGDNCILHRHSNADVTGLATLNSAWWPMSVIGVHPAPFFSRQETLSVPTLHLHGAAALKASGTAVLQLGLQDFRYGVLLFPNAKSVIAVQRAADEVLSGSSAGDSGSRKLRVVDLEIPSFIIRCDLRSDNLSPGSPRAVKLVTILGFNERGVGRDTNWPPLIHGPLRNVTNEPPVKVALDHPFFFAIVRYDTKSLLFAGYIARPMLNE